MDDLVRYRLFKESVWAAPQEDFLEEVSSTRISHCRSLTILVSQFYASFGSKPISSLVEESLATSGEGNVKIASEIRQLIIERLPLFLHDRIGKPTAFKFGWFKLPENFVVGDQTSCEGVQFLMSLSSGKGSEGFDRSKRTQTGKAKRLQIS